MSENFASERLDLFWRFVCERQLIWRRRIAQRLPPPWTDDPTLQHERFTNVYRELDPGTRYVIEQILEADAPRPDKLFNVMLYRLVGRAETHAALGFQYLATFDPSALERSLKARRRAGRPPFTAAYMVSAYSAMGSSDKIENVARIFASLHAHFDELVTRLDHCATAADVHSALRSAYGFGNFLAYQVLVDLLYPLRVYGNEGWLPFSHNDWASAGPGAQRGILMLLRPNTIRPALEVMRWLRDHQQAEFARLNLNFPYLEDTDCKAITISLANIQNCLCEFHKYVKIREGTGRGRRKFADASGADCKSVQMSIALDDSQREPG